MPVLEPNQPQGNEMELPFISLPAILAGISYQVCSFQDGRGQQGREVVSITVSNGGLGPVTLRNENGREFVAQAGQAAAWDLSDAPEGYGTQFVTLTPDVDLLAKEVGLAIRVRRVG